jgi:hypothetical protein
VYLFYVGFWQVQRNRMVDGMLWDRLQKVSGVLKSILTSFVGSIKTRAKGMHKSRTLSVGKSCPASGGTTASG